MESLKRAGLVMSGFFLLLLAAAFAVADEIEFLNGSKLLGNVITIHKADREVEFEAVIGGKKQAGRYPYAKIHRVVWKGKEYIVTKHPTRSIGNAIAEDRDRTESEVKKIIQEVGGSDPEWLGGTPLDFPKTLDLTWPQPLPKGTKWDNQKNVGQYIWDRINPNANRWRSGVRLMLHLKQLHTKDSELQQRVITSLASMYFRFFQDYARAAYWWEKSGPGESTNDAVGLSECYFRLGNKQMARSLLKKQPASLAKIKLLGDMGETREALKLANSVRMQQPHELYLLAGDVCRLDRKFKDAIEWYQKVLDAPDARNEDYTKRFRGRARDSIESIRRFELLDLAKIADGTYSGVSLGYEDDIEIEATVKGGRIEKVEITKHREKQYYSALIDVPAQIIRKQNLSEVEATSRATITGAAIINATAQALSDAQKN